MLGEFNDLNKNNDLIRSNPYMRESSIVSSGQINTVNFLNSIPFEINKTMLNYLLQEWSQSNNSIIFKNYKICCFRHYTNNLI